MVLDPIKIQKKLKLASDLFEFAFKLKNLQIKLKNPQLSQKKVRDKAYELVEKASEDHLKDIRGILAESEVDKNYLDKWVNELRLSTEWNLL